MKKTEVESLFHLAGIPVLRMWELPNQYFPYREGETEETTLREAVYRATRPWWLVKTAKGMIEIGPRKRVISIDWSDCGVQAEVTKDEVTKDPTMVHAYSLIDAAKYLTALAPHLVEGVKA